MTRQAANQAKLDRLMADAQRRLAARTPIGATRNDPSGISRWNGTVWVYDRWDR
jgi:hypothetical protein